MIGTIFIMPNKETDPTATMMIVVDEVTPETNPKTYQYVYVGNINDLPSDVLTEGSIVNDLTTGGTNKPLSAEQGRTLNSHVNYTTCGSGASDQVKLISDDGFELSTHLRLLVMMTNTNTNSAPKFNINNTGVKDVWYNGAVASDTNTWSSGEVLDIYYDGTNYIATTYGGAQFSTGEKVGDVGIDDEPTAGSDNLVKSSGVFDSEKLLGQDILGGNEEITGFDLLQYTVNADGKFGTSISAVYKHAAIPVQEGEIYYLIGTSQSCRAAFATSNDYSQGGDIPLVTNTEVMLMPNIGQYYKFVIPEGCTYFLFNAGNNYGTRLYKHYNHDLKLLIGETNGILKVDHAGNYKVNIIITEDTEVICDGQVYTLVGNTSISITENFPEGNYCLILENGVLSIIPYNNSVGKNIFAIFSVNRYETSTGGNLPYVSNIIYSAIPVNLGRETYMLGGFTSSPINFDNINKKNCLVRKNLL